jgi:hypothetical protein
MLVLEWVTTDAIWPLTKRVVMTSLTSQAYEKLEKEREERRAAGYLLLGEWPANMDKPLRKRATTLHDEAIAAGLIWDKPSPMASARDRGVSPIGERFFVLGDAWALAHDFFIRPGMFTALIDYLDGNHTT